MGVITTDSLPTDPLAALLELAQGEVELDRLRRAQVRAARESGASWEQIGGALGMTKQAAWEYFTREARVAIERDAAANQELGEDEALDLAVEEVRAVRRRRPRH